MLGFVLGGISGLINASYTVNLVVHNTSWVPGHFHLTVGTAVALSFMGIAYWLVPHLTGRELVSRRLGVLQGWLWFIGVLIFARGQISAGIESLPRRLNVSKLNYVLDNPAWHSGHVMTAVGGTIMFISGALFVALIAWTLWRGKESTIVKMPVVDEYVSGPEETPPLLDRWGVWIAIAIVLILIAYGPFFLTYAPNFVSGGQTPW
jgi:cytochrome c oxidase subunit 1